MNESAGLQFDLKRKNGMCVVKFCRDKALSRKGRKKPYRYCAKHRRQHDKERDPVGYHFDVLRQNAKRRKVAFKLTKKQFALFCAETDYLRLKGRYKDSLTIDRIDPLRGYEAGNIQVLKNGENVRKMHADKKLVGAANQFTEEVAEIPVQAWKALADFKGF
jgi:hypothetical protein